MPKKKSSIHKQGISFDGFEDVIRKMDAVYGDIKGTTDKALKETHRIITEKAEKAIQPQNLPAQGKYSQGDTEKSLVKDVRITWNGNTATVDVGFDFDKSGETSVFLMYGTPRHKVNHPGTAAVRGLFNSFYGKATREEVKKTQEDIFYQALRELGL